MKQYSFEVIGTLHTCFKEKFGIPRQPGIVSQATGILKLRDDPLLKQALKSIDTFSHLWVIWVFHEHAAKNWKPSIRPPRLGGAKKVGSLASRSPHRPNPIGLSAVKLERVDWEAEGGVELHVSGVDVLDGTPVLDIKPYIPYADSIPDANAGWADAPITRTPVRFTEQGERATAEKAGSRHPTLRDLIIEMLEIDPRPAFQKRRMPADSVEAQGTRYGFRLLDFDVKWEIRDGGFIVLDVVDFIQSE
jgi:tRNA-Thr(GGU) m(6)t(6)A37 methyltransferase TsaA